MTSEPGSFARQTIVERKPQILQEVSRAYPYPPEIRAGLEAFAAEIRGQPIAPLRPTAADAGLWNGALAPLAGRTWLEAPWYLAESFFYRRLMEVVQFDRPGPWYDVDPFAPQKAAELERALPLFMDLLARPEEEGPAAFARLLSAALWGNRADLSNRTVSIGAGEGLRDSQAGRLLIDDTQSIWRHLAAGRGGRVDVVADNSGLELLLDLRLADWLISRRLARIRFHLKRMPFFVSDAMRRDFEHTLDRLAAGAPPGAALADRLRRAMAEGRLTVRDDPFWSTCLSYHQLTPEVAGELSAAHLVLFKGDVNYRRLLDDRHWPHTLRLARIAAHMPAPFAALRTLKGELIVDLQPGQAEALAAADPTWMIDGQRGVIQFVVPGAGDG